MDLQFLELVLIPVNNCTLTKRTIAQGKEIKLGERKINIHSFTTVILLVLIIVVASTKSYSQNTNIVVDTTKIWSVSSLFEGLGQKIYGISESHFVSQQIDLSMYPKGIYTLKISYSDHMFVSKIIHQ